AHPGPADLLLLVEVAASSLRFDRDVKLPLYARHGIPEVWLVDIENSRLEIYSQPQMNGYVETRAPVSTLTPIDVPGMAGMAVDLSGLFS
ncbi:MAG: Uma2 family endonuclease, partial [Gammaproteobacteria bacterium]|nr:Uma2 family endonuclease [Gammaproteobacteria bacterium]